MCLSTDNPIPKIAKKPIKVWKRLKIFKIKDKIIYRTPCQYSVVKVGDSLKGLFPNKEVEENTLASEYIIDAQGVHAYKTQKEAEFWQDSCEIIAEWEIPAGAKYWVGNGSSKEEIAATEMKFIKVCD